jgi:hypothetical protein
MFGNNKHKMEEVRKNGFISAGYEQNKLRILKKCP